MGAARQNISYLSSYLKVTLEKQIPFPDSESNVKFSGGGSERCDLPAWEVSPRKIGLNYPNDLLR